jgi:hypothetical protein
MIKQKGTVGMLLVKTPTTAKQKAIEGNTVGELFSCEAKNTNRELQLWR